MPKRVPFPGTTLLPEDVLPIETSQDDSNKLSLRAFFHDYCVISTNPNLSQSYLPGLEMMTRHQEPDSNLVRACQAVSFATHGKPLNRPKLLEKAGFFYQDLLGSVAKAFENPTCVDAIETRYIVMLLGVYQVLSLTMSQIVSSCTKGIIQIAMDNETDYGSHGIHAKGLAALMHTEPSPFSLLGICQSNHKLGETLDLCPSKVQIPICLY